MARFPEQPSDLASSNGGPAAAKRVLVVDDDQDIRRLLAKVIETLKIHVSLADNGEEALRMFREGAFDLVITDIQMPKMDGYCLMREIKAMSRNTPVVLITGQVADSVQANAAAAAAETVLYKPFRLEAIIRVVEQIVQR